MQNDELKKMVEIQRRGAPGGAEEPGLAGQRGMESTRRLQDAEARAVEAETLLSELKTQLRESQAQEARLRAELSASASNSEASAALLQRIREQNLLLEEKEQTIVELRKLQDKKLEMESQAQLDALSRELSAARAEANEAHRQRANAVEQLQQQQQGIGQEHEDLKRNAGAMQARLAEMTRTLDTLRAERNHLVAQQSVASQQSQNSENQALELTALRHENAALKKRMQADDVKQRDQLQSTSGMQSQVAKMSEDSNRARAELQQARAEVQGAKADTLKLEQEIGGLRGQLAEAQRKLAESSAEAGNAGFLQQQLTEARTKIAHLESLQLDTSTLNSQLAEARGQVTQMQSGAHDAAFLQQQLAEARNQKAQTDQGLRRLEAESGNLQNQLAEAQARVAEMEQAANRERQEKLSVSQQGGHKISQLESELQAARNALEHFKAKDAERDETLHAFGQKEQHLQKVVNQLRTENERLKQGSQDAASLQGQLQRAQQQLAESGTKLAHQSERISAIQQELEATRAENSKLSSNVQRGVIVSEQLESMKASLQGKDDEIFQLRTQLNKNTIEYQEQGRELDRVSAIASESTDNLNDVRSRMGGITQQLNDRTAECMHLNEQLREAREEATSVRSDRDGMKFTLSTLGKESDDLQRLVQQLQIERDGTRENLTKENQTLQQSLKEVRAEVVNEREQSQDLYNRATQAEKQVEELQQMVADYRSRVADLDEQLGQVSRQVQSKDVSLAKMANTRQSMTNHMDDMEMENQLLREDGDTLRKKLEETSSQLQVAHSRILTLEKKVRDIGDKGSEIKALQEELTKSEDTVTEHTKRIHILEDEISRLQQDSETLGKKEQSLQDQSKRNSALLSELESVQRNNENLRREVQAANDKLAKSIGVSEDLQRQLEATSEAMAFSEKMMNVSREQTESLHALRERLKAQEEAMAVQQDHADKWKAEARLEAAELRARIVALSDNNNILQEQLLETQTSEKADLTGAQGKIRDLQDQLNATLDQNQASFMKYNQVVAKNQHMKALVIKRVIGQWRHATVSAAFSGWVYALESERYYEDEGANGGGVEEVDRLIRDALGTSKQFASITGIPPGDSSSPPPTMGGGLGGDMPLRSNNQYYVASQSVPQTMASGPGPGSSNNSSSFYYPPPSWAQSATGKVDPRSQGGAELML